MSENYHQSVYYRFGAFFVVKGFRMRVSRREFSRAGLLFVAGGGTILGGYGGSTNTDNERPRISAFVANPTASARRPVDVQQR